MSIVDNLETLPTYYERAQNALKIAWQYGQIDGSHHKMWVIDQMVKALCENENEYKNWVEAYEKPLSDGDYYLWEVGIAP